MLLALDYPLEGIEDRIRRASAPTSALISHIVARACTRHPAMKKAGKAPGIDRLIEAEAWFDVALALLKTELPSWSIRRIIYDDGEWFCSLSQAPYSPAALDDTADFHHQSLPLAILGALFEARKRKLPVLAAVQGGSDNRPNAVGGVSCDNFG
jgi:hypothetical protein